MAEATASVKRKKSIIRRIFEVREVGALLPLVILFVAAALSNEAFISVSNLLNMLRATSYLFIVGVGMTFVLCGRGLDLSVGSQFGLSGIVLGMLMVWWNVPVWASIPIALVVGVAAGAVNGFLVTVLRIPPFIATLATFNSYRGILQGITKAAPIGPMPPGYRALGAAEFLGVSWAIWFMFLLLLLATFILRKMRYGRYVLAMGGNEESTRLAGIDTRRLTFSLYVVSGLLSAVAGVFFNARFSSAQTVTGTGMEFQAIAACIIGGVSLFGGSGSMVGTLIGCVFLTVIENGMIMAHISGYWQQAVVGLIIVLAIVIDLLRKGDLKKS